MVDLNDLQAMQGIGMMSRRRATGCGCLGAMLFILTMTVVIGGAAIAVLPVVLPDFNLNALLSAAGPFGAGPEQRPIDQPAAFDPLTSYDEAAALAGEGARLIEMRVLFIRADGTLDLTATYTPAPYAEYTFAREVPRPDNAPPPGVSGSGSVYYEEVMVIAERPGQSRRVTEETGTTRRTYTYVTQGWRREPEAPTNDRYEFIGEPVCSFRAMWQDAIERGVPADAVAIISYDDDGYQFRVNDAINLRYDAECQLES